MAPTPTCPWPKRPWRVMGFVDEVSYDHDDYGHVRDDVWYSFHIPPYVQVWHCPDGWEERPGRSPTCDSAPLRLGVFEWDEVNAQIASWDPDKDVIDEILDKEGFRDFVEIALQMNLCTMKCPLPARFAFGQMTNRRVTYKLKSDPQETTRHLLMDAPSGTLNNNKIEVSDCEAGWDSNYRCLGNSLRLGQFWWDESKGRFSSAKPNPSLTAPEHFTKLIEQEVRENACDTSMIPVFEGYKHAPTPPKAASGPKPKPTDPDDPSARRNREGYVIDKDHPHYGERYNPYKKRWSFMGLRGVA